MIAKVYLRKLYNFYHTYIKPPKKWTFPEKSDILIYDGSGSSVLMKYFKDHSVYIHYVRGEEISVPCFVAAIFSRSFWFEAPAKAYVNEVIKIVSPKIVITFIDNDELFYTISSQHSFITSILVQNGWRGGSGDVFSRLIEDDKRFVSYMFVFNNCIGQKYSEYLKGTAIVLGSFKNNYFLSDQIFRRTKDRVIFISQFRKETSGPMYVDIKGRDVSWKDFFKCDELVVLWLMEWCAHNKKKLMICGGGGEDLSEYCWYKSILENYIGLWEYFPKNKMFDSYGLVHDSEVVVTIDSTLGYEAFGAGKKTAFMTGRGRCLDDQEMKYGWPGMYPDKGKFWSNFPERSELFRIMDYLKDVSVEEWRMVCEEYGKDIMCCDPGNNAFKKLISKIL